MFSRGCCLSRIASRMAQRNLPPGVYLQIVSASNQVQGKYDIQNNPLFEKYAEKIKHLKGTNPTLYEERMAQLCKLYQPSKVHVPSDGSSVDSPPKQIQSPDVTGQPSEGATCNTSVKTDCRTNSTVSQTKCKNLDSIMKMELLEDKTVDEIQHLWKEYHIHKDCVFAAISGTEYDEIYKRSQEFPTFLYPVPREGGYEFFVQQFNDNSIYFTTLGAFQTHKGDAPHCLVLDHYTELQKNKDLVLMRGELDNNILSIHEAQVLTMQVQRYYGHHSSLKVNLLRQFNNNPEDFNYVDLIKEFDNYNNDYKELSTEFKQDKTV